MKRRAFFQSVAKAAAILALAPQLAFRAKPSIPTVEAPPRALRIEYNFTAGKCSRMTSIGPINNAELNEMNASWLASHPNGQCISVKILAENSGTEWALPIPLPEEPQS